MADLRPDQLLHGERAMLNKIYRAVHDGVCPQCGRDMDRGEFSRNCAFCGFSVGHDEMHRMRVVIPPWGKEAVEFFREWRKRK